MWAVHRELFPKVGAREIGIGLGVVDLSDHDERGEIVGAMEYARIVKCHLLTLFPIAVESSFPFLK